LVVTWSDLRADPRKAGNSLLRFRPAKAFRWPGAKAERVEVACFGVEPDKQRSLEGAWSPFLAPRPKFFEPGHRIKAGDFGLSERTAW
jgi:hypothetical protein